jgi:hypothetical protein
MPDAPDSPAEEWNVADLDFWPVREVPVRHRGRRPAPGDGNRVEREQAVLTGLLRRLRPHLHL